MLNKLVKFQDSGFAFIAWEKFELHCQGTCIIPADLRGVVYRAVMSKNGKRAFPALLNVSSWVTKKYLIDFSLFYFDSFSIFIAVSSYWYAWRKRPNSSIIFSSYRWYSCWWYLELLSIGKYQYFLWNRVVKLN